MCTLSYRERGDNIMIYITSSYSILVRCGLIAQEDDVNWVCRVFDVLAAQSDCHMRGDLKLHLEILAAHLQKVSYDS